MKCHLRCQAPIIVALASVLILVLSWRVPSGAMSLDEARAMVKAAREANKRGDHAQAVRLAKKVLDEVGDIMVYWPGEGAKHPAPEADIQNPEAFARAQQRAARETGADMEIHIAGTNARGELFMGYYGQEDWPAVAELAAQFVGESSDLSGAWSALYTACKHLAAQHPTYPCVVLLAGRTGRLLSEVTGDGQSVWIGVRALARVPTGAVSWNPAADSARLVIGARAFEFRAGSHQVLADGKTITVPHPPRIRDGRTWVSADSLKAVGFYYEMNAEAKLLVLAIH